MEHLLHDFRYAIRMIRKHPGFSIVVILSLAIGIGANTAVFSVTDGLLLRPLRYPEPDRLAELWLRSPGLGIDQDWPSPGEYVDIQTQNNVFEETAIAIGRSLNLTGLAQPERVDVIQTSSSLLKMLGAKPLLGRALIPEEDAPGKPDTAVLTYAIWKRLFGADKEILGKNVTLNGKPYSIVGVLQPDFVLNHEVMPTVGAIDKAEMFLPLPLGADAANDRGNENFNVLARLKPGVTAQAAQADIDVIASRIREQDRRDPTFTISVVPLLDQVVGNVRRAVLVLLGAVGLVLLIACANVANLLLARAAGRQKEIAIRSALGADRKRLIGQMLTESVLISLLGGIAGLGLAAASLYLMRAINPGNIPRLDEIGINGEVLFFTLSVSTLTGIVFGMAPALRAARVDVNSSLKAGGRDSRTGGLGIGRDKLRSLLVVTELALSLLLLIGAGLLIRSFAHIQTVRPGFDPDNVISLQVSLGGPRYQHPNEQATARFYEELGQRVSNLPGVKAQGAVSALPLTASVGWGGVEVEGYVPPPSEPELQVDLRIATPDYFRALDVPLMDGRFFSDSDTADSMPVVLIDKKMADRFWPGESAVGKRVRNGSKGKWLNIVGVVGVVKQYGLDADTRMVVYYPNKRATSGSMYLVARTSVAPESVASAIVGEVHALDSEAPVYDVRTMKDRLSDSLARRRFSAVMLSAFACFALALAAIGVYAILSYTVSQGVHDIGVRLALGAQRGSIVRLVVGHGMVLALAGIGGGLIGGAILTRLMASLLYGTSATDSLTFAGVAGLLALIALAACYIPARRATRIDPIRALREE
jgi:predicted permease